MDEEKHLKLFVFRFHFWYHCTKHSSFSVSDWVVFLFCFYTRFSFFLGKIQWKHLFWALFHDGILLFIFKKSSKFFAPKCVEKIKKISKYEIIACITWVILFTQKEFAFWTVISLYKELRSRCIWLKCINMLLYSWYFRCFLGI